MTVFVADDVEAICKRMEYERGFLDGVQGKTRASPEGCKDRPAWLEGFDEGVKLKPKGE